MISDIFAQNIKIYSVWEWPEVGSIDDRIFHKNKHNLHSINHIIWIASHITAENINCNCDFIDLRQENEMALNV